MQARASGWSGSITRTLSRLKAGPPPVHGKGRTITSTGCGRCGRTIIRTRRASWPISGRMSKRCSRKEELDDDKDAESGDRQLRRLQGAKPCDRAGRGEAGQERTEGLVSIHREL